MINIDGQVSVAPKLTTSYNAVAEHLMREIALGNYVAGDKLPPERTLAEQLGVARETLRQALRMLEGNGLIEIRRGAQGGAIVLSKEADQQATLLGLAARREEILNIIEFRLVLEPHAAELAAKRRTQEHLARMVQMQADLLASETKDEARRADTAFHAAIVSAARNPMIEKAVEDARVLMFAATDMIFYEFQTHSSYNAHAEILSAIENQDPQAAREAMERHINITILEFNALISNSL